MRIVDAQIHLWGSGLPSNMSHRQVTAFTTEEALGMMNEGGVDAAVIHPPGWDPGSTEMAFKAVRENPGRFAFRGAVPLNQPDMRSLVEPWRKQPAGHGSAKRPPGRRNSIIGKPQRLKLLQLLLPKSQLFLCEVPLP